MPDHTHPEMQYLTPTTEAFWRWSPDFEAVEWPDGTTIAFRHELVAILRRLLPDGVPDFELVLLVLAACRPSWHDEPLRKKLLRESLSLRGRIKVTQWVDDVISLLDRLHQLPADLRESCETKRELVAFIFEAHPLCLEPEQVECVDDVLELGPTEELWIERKPQPRLAGQWMRELRGLIDGGRRVSEERLRNWNKTGLERPLIPKPPARVVPEEPQPASRSVNELLEELERDEEFRALVQLTRNLMAVIHLPRPIAEEQELPLGGVSDISNRGPLDRLLLSELAQDNDILTFRVAMQEAMYIRRERPPSVPPHERVVLLDSGLRMWGVPRVYATAVALSAAALGNRNITTRVFRAAGDDVAPVDLTTRQGLTDHLHALHPAAHPGLALPALARELEGGDSELLLVTGEDVLADPEFRAQLAESDLCPLYLVAVRRDGQVRLIARSRSGDRVLREATLDLEALTRPQSSDSPTEEIPPAPLIDPQVDPQVDPRLPAILRLREFPLRWTAAVEFGSNSFWVPHREPNESGFVCTVTEDGRFLVWDQPDCGARQLRGLVPKLQRPRWTGAVLDQKFTCVIGSGDFSTLHLLQVDLAERSVTVLPLPKLHRGRFDVCGHAGVVFVIGRKEVEAFSSENGMRLKGMRIPAEMTWTRDRFFRADDGFYALSFDGFSARMEKVLRHDRIHPHLVAGLFDSPHHDAPVAVLKDGALVHSDGQSLGTVRHGLALPVSLGAVSSDGKGLVLTGPSHPGEGAPIHHASLEFSGSEIGVRDRWGEIRHPELLMYYRLKPRVVSLRTQFHGIVAQRSHLTLITKSNEAFALTHDRGRERLVLRAVRPNPYHGNTIKEFVSSKRKRRSNKPHFDEAVWPDGSRAVLDSRGLLHLQCSNPHIPECTLVLYEDHVAGWCSDGRRLGPRYFLGDPTPPYSAESILNTVILPFLAHVS